MRFHSKSTLRIVATAVLLACTGCMPVTVYDSPQIQGRVIDSETGTPIENAEIILKNKSDIEARAKTKLDGSFDIDAVTRKIWMLPVPFDAVAPNVDIEISASGYESIRIRYYEFRDRTVRLVRE